jgi:phosphoribosylformimino-5-aminoimidazole carboxamide ribonucleotide (ProFAR) isomerase
MPFTVLPAVDLARGRLVAITPEGPEPVDAFGGDPVAAATAFRDAGARWIHVVDVDLARTGETIALDTVRAIAALEGVRVQASGGVRTADHVEAMRAAGAGRVVLSSAALVDEDAVASMLAGAAPGQLVVGVEVEHGRISSRAAGDVDLDLLSTLGWLRTAGATSFLVTAVSRVGTGQGPDLELIKRVAQTGVETLAAGGIGSMDGLRSVRGTGAVGAVVGRAAVEGTIDLAAALRWAAV